MARKFIKTFSFCYSQSDFSSLIWWFSNNFLFQVLNSSCCFICKIHFVPRAKKKMGIVQACLKMGISPTSKEYYFFVGFSFLLILLLFFSDGWKNQTYWHSWLLLASMLVNVNVLIKKSSPIYSTYLFFCEAFSLFHFSYFLSKIGPLRFCLLLTLLFMLCHLL